VKRNQHIGSSLDDFLKEEGILEETRADAEAGTGCTECHSEDGLESKETGVVMIHKAKDLSSDQKTVIEGLLGRPVSEDDAISIRAMGSGSAPEWLKASWEGANRSGANQLSMDEIDAEIEAARRVRHTRGQTTEQ